MDYLTIEGVKPYDGRYEFDIENHALTTREWGWIKRHSGYLPTTIADGYRANDPELFAVFAVIALHRAGRIDFRDVGDMFERIADTPFSVGTTITIEGDVDEIEDADVDPPAPSGSASETSNGSASPTSSETSPLPPSSSGASGSDVSESPPARLAT